MKFYFIRECSRPIKIPNVCIQTTDLYGRLDELVMRWSTRIVNLYDTFINLIVYIFVKLTEIKTHDEEKYSTEQKQKPNKHYKSELDKGSTWMPQFMHRVHIFLYVLINDLSIASDEMTLYGIL